MPEASRSGRVVIGPGATQVLVLANLAGNKKAIYRVFNGGKDGTAVEVRRNGAVEHTLEWKHSVDLSIGNETLSVTAGANEAEIVYDLIAVI